MISISGYRIVVLLVVLAWTEANDSDSSKRKTAQSSTSFTKAGLGEGSFKATAYNGRTSDPARDYYYPLDSLYNIWTYASYLQQYIAQLQRVVQQQIEAQKEHMNAASGMGRPPPSSGNPLPNPMPNPVPNPFANPFPNGEQNGGVFGAASTGFIGPGGGFGAATLLPSPTNAQGGAIPPNSNQGSGPGHQGVFTSSSSSSSNINGVQTSSHESTVGVDNNGQVTVYHTHDRR